MNEKQQKPWAIRQVVRGPSGKPTVQFLDAQSGQPIPPHLLPQYNLVDQTGNVISLEELGIDPVKDQAKTPEEETTANTLLREDESEFSKLSPGKNVIDSARGDSTKGQFGFIDKPMGLELAAAFGPGILGMGAKAANTGINANNVNAVGKARQVAGLDDRGLGEKGKNILFGQDPYVGDIEITTDDMTTDNQKTNQYSVGLDAVDPAGRTTLTPEEARRRGLTSGNEVRTPTRQETKADIDLFRQTEYGIPKKTFGDRVSKITDDFGKGLEGVANSLGNFVDNLFGVDTPPVEQFEGDNSNGDFYDQRNLTDEQLGNVQQAIDQKHSETEVHSEDKSGGLGSWF